jgi:hypothetical protein
MLYIFDITEDSLSEFSKTIILNEKKGGRRLLFKILRDKIETMRMSLNKNLNALNNLVTVSRYTITIHSSVTWWEQGRKLMEDENIQSTVVYCIH